MESPESSHSEITQLAIQAGRGDQDASEALFEKVYHELHQLAEHMMRQEHRNNTMQATALVHEAFIRLSQSDDQGWLSSAHFLNTAALIMRRTLIDRARMRMSKKRGGDAKRVPIDFIEIPAQSMFADDELGVLSDALDELASQNTRVAQTINFRVFLGLSVDQTAQAIGVSHATVKSDYRFGLLWLRSRIATTPQTEDSARERDSDER